MQLQASTVGKPRRARRSRAAPVSWHQHMISILNSARVRFVVFSTFLLIVALMGGSSRSDIPSLVYLRPIAVLSLVYAFFCISSVQLREVRAPLMAAVALMLYALSQLVPLPPPLWTNLPNRETVVEVSTLVGMRDVWRPLSLDPDRTWNTFFALFVPLAAVSLVAIQDEPHRRLVVPVLVATGLLSASFGFLQAIGGSGLVLYDIAHRGYPVGLFANRNHQSILLLWTMLAGCWMAATAAIRQHAASKAIGGALAVILVLFPLLILTGSRAGLLLSVPTLALCAWLLLRAPATEEIVRRASRRVKLVLASMAAIAIAVLVFVFGVLAFSTRNTALSRLFEVEVAEGLRWRYLPVFVDMIRDYLPFGSGFGSFEKVFNAYEPVETLSTRYMNQAHNDPVQLAIEGGMPALVIAFAVLIWFVRRLYRMWRTGYRTDRLSAVFFGGSIALWLAASLVDYPLRTPLAAMLVVALTARLSLPSTGIHSGPGLPDRQGAQGEVS